MINELYIYNFVSICNGFSRPIKIYLNGGKNSKIDMGLLSLKDYINKLMESNTLKKNDDESDRLNMFKQQALLKSEKIQSIAEKLEENRRMFKELSEEATNKAKIIESMGEIIKADKIKSYVTSLRSKNNEYKEKRQCLIDIKAECGVLSRTLQILDKKNEKINIKLSENESKVGISGYWDTNKNLQKVSSKKMEFDETKVKSLDEISRLVTQLNISIDQKKKILAPIMQELKPLRENHGNILMEYNHKKKKYEMTQADIESNMSGLENNVNKLAELIISLESKINCSTKNLHILCIEQERLNDEKNVHFNRENEAKMSFKEQCIQEIHKQESNSINLRKEQQRLNEMYEINKKDVIIWKNIQTIFKTKLDLIENKKYNDKLNHLIVKN
ncbi:hypothetical protein A3Q56_05063 [Intoshia linei]|uniref:Intraflagellar transport protein 81 n=1 Tax=Intoshia linei TaxID=1819745 RepID=A0A177B054_9BILA|nr:hypothetical protein A3Q56_05063 [Intoshia linei]